jgi:hypothetical protein
MCAFWIGINVEGHTLAAGSVAGNDGILTVAEDDVPFFIWPDGSSGWHGRFRREKGPRPGDSILYLPEILFAFQHCHIVFIRWNIFIFAYVTAFAV